jgi:predicted PurR-regulated permease PerM
LLALLFAIASFIPVIGVWIGCLPGLALLVGRGHFVDVVGLILALAGLACVRLLWCNPALFEHRQFFHPTVAIILLLVVLQLGGLWGVVFYYPLASLLATINWLYGPNRAPDTEAMVGI